MSNNKIKLLDEQTINQMAAGEVIENPASVVKELVENAIDAGAQKIRVEIEAGGRERIAVIDDGCGMGEEDAVLALERYATSKIRNVDDLEKATTLGFRGEALASILSVSKIRMKTCLKERGGERESGRLLIAEGGKILSLVPVTCEGGTEIEVHSLFFNVPVRRKFQKSPAFDVQDVQQLLLKQALAHPEIGFTLISEGKQIFKVLASVGLDAHEALKARIALLGETFAQQAIPLSYQANAVCLMGMVSPPALHKPNRTGQYLFLNGRSITSTWVGAVVKEAYGPMLPSLRYPMWVLHLRVPTDWVDVNVHPQKKEVRLRNESLLKQALVQAVRDALHPTVRSTEEMPVPTPLPWEGSSLSGLTPPPLIPQKPETMVELPPWTPSLPPVTPSKTSVQLVWTPPTNPSLPTVLSTIVGYFLVEPKSGEEAGTSWGIVDQKAAHHRIYWDELFEKMHSRPISSQKLFLPLKIHFSPKEVEILLSLSDPLHQMGWQWHVMGNETILVEELPYLLSQEEAKSCLEALLEEGKKESFTNSSEELLKKWLLRLSQTSRIGKKRLSLLEATEMVKTLFQTSNPLVSPQGKPILRYISGLTIQELLHSI